MTTAKKRAGLLTERRRSRLEPRAYFEYCEHEIVLVLSMFSGLEQVYADKQLVSRRRNWYLRSVHTFEINGVTCELEVVMAKGVKNLFRHEMDVCLKADGKMVDQDRIHGLEHMIGKMREPMAWKRLLLFLLPFFVAGGAIGFAVGYLVLGKLL